MESIFEEDTEMAAKPAKKTAVKAVKKPEKKLAKKSAAPKTAAKAAKEEKKGHIPSGSKVEPAPLSAGTAEGSEEEMDEFEGDSTGSAGAASAGLNAAASAAAAVELSNSMKNFRHHPDMENFYRFIYDNDLRFEALTIIDQILIEKRAKKVLKVAKAKSH